MLYFLFTRGPQKFAPGAASLRPLFYNFGYYFVAYPAFHVVGQKHHAAIKRRQNLAGEKVCHSIIAFVIVPRMWITQGEEYDFNPINYDPNSRVNRNHITIIKSTKIEPTLLTCNFFYINSLLSMFPKRRFPTFL